MRELIDSEGVSRGLRRVAGQIVERQRGAEGLVLIGVRRGGEPLAREIGRWIHELESRDVPVGSVDITLYRDDSATALPNPRIGPSQIPCSLQGKRVVLVDDVVFTGRTIRAAIDALMDYGRPERIELAALVDRGGRELPIQPDYVVLSTEVGPLDRIDVLERPDGIVVVLRPGGSPSTAPSP